ncbi:MAG: hypothetical protein JNK05_23595 [Myxococcales bacterium]|nr:hypothetical protein [Myxococcales bacterium]
MQRMPLRRSIALSAVSVLALALTRCAPGAGSAPCSPMGAPIVHQGSISASERWASGIHLVSSSLTLSENTVVTIESCSEVRLAPNASINVTNNGSRLVAEGTEPRPIRFVRSEAASAWGRVLLRTGGSASFSHTTFEGGGGPTSDIASADFLASTIAAQADAATLPQLLKVDRVTVRGSAGVGIALIAARFTADSTNLTVSGSGSYPVYLGADALSELPTGTYTGNGRDEILLHDCSTAAYSNNRDVVRDTVAHNRGVPYRVSLEGASSALVRVGDGRQDGPASATFEIEAGVTMRFSRTPANSGITALGRMVSGSWVAQGALRVMGTASAPVTLTSASASPAAGDWMGLYFKDVVHAQTRIEHAIIEYAGSDSGTRGVCPMDGANNIDADSAVIIFLQTDQTPSAFMSNTTIRHSAGGGVYRHWWTESVVDFVSGNTFENIAGCRQSSMPATRGGCPMPACS